MNQPTVGELGVSPAPGRAPGELTPEERSRAQFLKMVGGVGAAGAFATLVAACGGGGGQQQPQGGAQGEASGGAGQFGQGDIGILNYALTLEYLEADFYDKAVQSGKLNGKLLELARTFGQQEQEHVNTIKATIEQLGGQPVQPPKARFPLGSREEILKTAAEVENLGASAYLGQMARIQNQDVLSAALTIHSVEGRHAAALNRTAGKSIVPDGAFAQGADMETVLAAVKPFLQS